MNEFYGKIENSTGLPDDCQKILNRKLMTGKIITFPVWLCGGGQVHKKYFLKALENKKYENAFEWCAGHGEIGFEILTAGICKTLTFSDIHPASSEWCLKNAKTLGVGDQVSTYVSSTISELPQSTKWDLVIGNPPNAVNPDQRVIYEAKKRGMSYDHLLLIARTT